MIVHTELEEVEILGHFARLPRKIDRCHSDARNVRNRSHRNFDRGGRSLCTACGRQQQGGSGDQPVEIVAVLLFDELDCEAVGQTSDNTADAGSDGERHSDRRLHFSGYRGAGDRHVDDEATVSRAVGRQR